MRGDTNPPSSPARRGTTRADGQSRAWGISLFVSLLVGAAAGGLLIFGLTLLPQQQREATRWIEHTLQIIARAETLKADLAMVSSEGRGFVIDRTSESLARFENAVATAKADAAALRQLTIDNPVQQSTLDRLDPLVTERTDLLRAIIQRVQAGDDGAPPIMRARGRRILDQLATGLDDIKSEEERLLHLRENDAGRASSLTVAGVVACGALIVASALFALVLLSVRIRERKHLAVLRDSEARFRGTFDQAAVGVAHVGLDGRWLEVNAKLCSLFGYSEAEMLRLTFQEISHPDDVALSVELARALIDGERQTFHQEKRYLRKDGAAVWIHLTVSMLSDAAGKPRHFISILEDISARKAAEQALRTLNEQLEARVEERTVALAVRESSARQSEAELRSILDSSADCIKLLDLEGKLLSINGSGQCALEIDDFTAFCNQPWVAVWPEEARAQVEDVLQAARSGAVRRFTAPCPTAKGTMRWWDSVVSPVIDADGLQTNLLAVSRDVTVARGVEEALRESEASFRLLAENASDMVSRVGPDGTRLYVSPACKHIFGVTADELILGGVRHLIHPDDLVATTAMQERLLKATVERDNTSFRILNPERGEVWAEVSAGPIRDPRTGEPAGYLSVVRDVTERKRAEAQLLHAQRMDAIGQVTAGVAHDFNNLLQAILGSLGLLHEQPGLDAEGAECVEIAERAAQRGAMLTQRLLAFSRKQRLEPVLLRPEEVVSDLSAMLARTLGGRIRVECLVDGDVWPVRADGAQLDNCLLNLSLNARDAMPVGGTLRLRGDNRGAEEALAAGLPEGDYVCLAVEDEGVGMPPETLAHALEPFFTTKPIGQGTGLGLSMVQGFARQSGGDVRIDSTPGVGTTVSIWLPRALGAAAVAFGSDANRAPRSATVMVVDDEATVRRTLAMFLSKAGFTPVDVDCGEAALRRLQAGEPCDLLVTDQSMPGMTGCELIEAAVKSSPGLKTMLITGYDKVSGLDRLEGRVTVLQKPFERSAFIRQVQALLGIAILGAGFDGGPSLHQSAPARSRATTPIVIRVDADILAGPSSR